MDCDHANSFLLLWLWLLRNPKAAVLLWLDHLRAFVFFTFDMPYLSLPCYNSLPAPQTHLHDMSILEGLGNSDIRSLTPTP